MKKILILFCLLPTLVFGQMWSELSKLMTCIDSTTWATYDASSPTTMNKRMSAAVLNTYVASKGIDFTTIPIGTGGTGSIFFKQTSTGNFSTSNKLYYDSLRNALLLSGTGLSHKTGARFTISGDSSRAATDSAYLLLITDPAINKNRKTIAQMIDTSSLSYKTTENTGKPQLLIKDNIGGTTMQIDTNQNVGIGLASTGAKLYVNGNIQTVNGAITASANISAGVNLIAIGSLYVGNGVSTAVSINKNSSRSTAAGSDLSINGEKCKAATANLNGGNIIDSTGGATGSGESQRKFATAGGGLTGGTTTLYPTVKMTINGVGRLNYTPRNTTQTGADSLTTVITMAPNAGGTVSNMGARVIDVTIRKSITITGIMIDTVGAVNGDEILIRNASPTGKTFSIADTIGSSVLFNSGAGRFVFTPMSNMYLTCQKRNNKTWWVEISRSSVTAR